MTFWQLLENQQLWVPVATLAVNIVGTAVAVIVTFRNGRQPRRDPTMNELSPNGESVKSGAVPKVNRPFPDCASLQPGYDGQKQQAIGERP